MDIERFVNEYLEKSVFPAEEEKPPFGDNDAFSTEDEKGPAEEYETPAADGRS